MRWRFFILGFLSCLLLGGGVFILLDRYLYFGGTEGSGYSSSQVPYFVVEGDPGYALYVEMGSEEYAREMEEVLEREMYMYFSDKGIFVERVTGMYRGDATQFTFVYTYSVSASMQQRRELGDLRERLSITVFEHWMADVRRVTGWKEERGE